MFVKETSVASLLLTAVILIAFLFLCHNLIRWLRGRTRVPNLSSRFVLITGCDTGFGRRLAERLDYIGMRVIATCLDHKMMTELDANTSDRVTTLLLDVTDEASVGKAYRTVKELLPNGSGIWALVNNAGVFGPSGPAEMMTRDDFMQPLRVNLLGMIEVTRVFLELVRRENGRIVNAVSILGRVAMGPAPYVVSKFACLGYSDMLRRELVHHNISVHAVLPGGYNTNLTDVDKIKSSMTRVFNSATPHQQKIYGENYVKKSIATVEQLKRHIFSSNMDEVVDVYVHAITSQQPSTYYVVCKNGNILLRLAASFPEWIVDWICSMTMLKPKQ